jgi:hypothetical protein
MILDNSNNDLPVGQFSNRSVEDDVAAHITPGEEWSVVSPDGHNLYEDVGDGNSRGIDSDDECDDHLYPPFASAVFLENVPEPDTAAPKAPVLRTVEVNAETGTIHVQVEQPVDDQEQQGNYSESQSTNTNSPDPFHRLTSYQKFWLIVFVRKCARKVIAVPRQATIKYGPKIKPLARRSAAALQKESMRAVSFVQQKSVEFDEKHQVREKAKTSIKQVGRHVKRASKASLEGVKTMSNVTIKTVKEVEDKHHIMRKSKNSIKKGGRIIRNAWNGKPLNTRPQSKPTSTTTGTDENEAI